MLYSLLVQYDQNSTPHLAWSDCQQYCTRLKPRTILLAVTSRLVCRAILEILYSAEASYNILKILYSAKASYNIFHIVLGSRIPLAICTRNLFFLGSCWYQMRCCDEIQISKLTCKLPTQIRFLIFWICFKTCIYGRYFSYKPLFPSSQPSKTLKKKVHDIKIYRASYL